MEIKTERRGRPAEGNAEPREKWEMTFHEVPTQTRVGT